MIESLNMHKHLLKMLFFATILFFCINISFAQTVPLTITTTQALNFGTICQLGSGGTVTVGYNGTRTSTGNILLLDKAPTAKAALYEIKLCPAGNVNITFDATTILTSGNGSSLTLDIGPTEKGLNGCSFMTNSDCNTPTFLRVGGTLHLEGNEISGNYSGSFTIIVNQQ
jgi:hypothetical protein